MFFNLQWSLLICRSSCICHIKWFLSIDFFFIVLFLNFSLITWIPPDACIARRDAGRATLLLSFNNFHSYLPGLSKTLIVDMNSFFFFLLLLPNAFLLLKLICLYFGAPKDLLILLMLYFLGLEKPLNVTCK